MCFTLCYLTLCLFRHKISLLVHVGLDRFHCMSIINGLIDMNRYYCGFEVILIYHIYSPISRIFGSEKSCDSVGFDIHARHMFIFFFTAPKSWTFNVLTPLLFGKISSTIPIYNRYIFSIMSYTLFYNAFIISRYPKSSWLKFTRLNIKIHGRKNPRALCNRWTISLVTTHAS